MMKQCPECGNKFSARNDAHKFCSIACSARSMAHAPRPVFEPEQRTCPVCQSVFLVGGRQGHKKHAVYCSRTCSQNARYVKSTECKTLTPAQAGYIAGFLDGEGSIMLVRRSDHNSYNLRITAAGTVRAPMDWMSEVAGVGATFFRDRNNPNHRPTYWWQIAGDAARTLLLQVAPFMLVKQQQAELAIEFQTRLHDPKFKTNMVAQSDYYHRLKAMNARGREAMSPAG